ncbi:hypothetical protein [Sporocytophaga myxococcoides]|nr:hypothetical protein [Sporocytophaga myxococcoides]
MKILFKIIEAFLIAPIANVSSMHSNSDYGINKIFIEAARDMEFIAALEKGENRLIHPDKMCKSERKLISLVYYGWKLSKGEYKRSDYFNN